MATPRRILAGTSTRRPVAAGRLHAISAQRAVEVAAAIQRNRGHARAG